jgi:hypothetical protein
MYDSFGCNINEEINIGDNVLYFDTIHINNIPYKRILKGIWNGEKVCFNDKEHTIVRTKKWLKKI